MTYAQNYDWRDTISEYPNKGTFYHDRFEGRKTASGEVFDQNKFTAAHWKIKLGTYILVTNRNTGLQVIVRVNDRCPKRGVIDLSHRAATAIGIRGCQPVTIRVLPTGYEERWKAQETMFDSVHTRLGTPVPEVKSSPTTADKPMPVFVSSNNRHEKTYFLWLGNVASHSDAYARTSHLPDIYKDQMLIEPLSGSDSLSLSLNVHLQKQQAEQLRRALLPTFPKTEIRLCD